MKVFKFGGASVSSADAICNAAEIIRMNQGAKILVVSAMGKTTNALEELVRLYFKSDENVWTTFESIKKYHSEIIDELWKEKGVSLPEIESLFESLGSRLKTVPSMNFDYEYDQIVSFGELLSTKIISLYFNKSGIDNQWIDVRRCIKTDDTYREGIVDWELSESQAKRVFTFENGEFYVTQGFIGGTSTNQTTTLGREGSDYTAAILANLLDAEDVSIWKNVPGVLNADPDYFQDTQKLEELSYKEAIELAYSGAKVIHPKTIKPLQNKNIPLLVKSFFAPEEAGTVIHSLGHRLELVPVYILKKKQALITLSPHDFSFISVSNLSDLYTLLAKYRLKISLIQQSAIDLSVAFDEPEGGIEELIKKLQDKFEVKYNTGLELITIRYYTPESITELKKERNIYIEQKSRRTARLLLR